MIVFPLAMRTALAAGDFVSNWLVWVEAKNRTTGAVETMGLWTGAYDRTFDLGGVARPYFGTSVLEIGEITYEAGLTIQMQRIGLASTTPEVRQLIRGFEARHAPVEMHLVLLDPRTEAVIGLQRMFKGWIDEVESSEGPKGGSGSMTVTLASSARAGTRTLGLKKSDESQKNAYPGDRGRRYSDVTKVQVKWGGETDKGYRVRKKR